MAPPKKRVMTMLPLLIFISAMTLAVKNLMTDTTNMVVVSNSRYNEEMVSVPTPATTTTTTTTKNNNFDDISLINKDSKDNNDEDKQDDFNRINSRKNLYNFTWDDIDFHKSTKKECGHYKCFFPSKTDPEVGYLVVKPKKDAKEVESQMIGWDIARNIELMHNARHFYLASPLLKKPTGKIRKKLREKLPDYPTGLNPPKRIVVQKVLKAPIDQVVIGCAPRRIPRSITRLFTILGMNNVSTPISSSSSSIISATNTFVNEMNNDLIPVVHAEPALVLDFQVMVDKFGQIYHFDLDRADRSPKDEEFQTCICNLRKMALFFSNSNLRETVRSKILSPIKNISIEEQVDLLGSINLNLSGSDSSSGSFGNLSECPSDLIGFNVAS